MTQTISTTYQWYHPSEVAKCRYGRYNEFGRRAFIYSAPLLWIDLLLSIRSFQNFQPTSVYTRTAFTGYHPDGRTVFLSYSVFMFFLIFTF